MKSAEYADWFNDSKLTRNNPNLKRYVIGDCTYGAPAIYYPDAANLTIGSYTSISENVRIFLADGHHSTRRVSTYPFSTIFKNVDAPNSVVSKGDVTIGSDVWLCNGCTIMSGVTVGDGAVVGMGSVVTRDVEPYSVMVGVPARRKRWRFSREDREALLRIRWWDWSREKVVRYASLLQNEDVKKFIEAAEKEVK